MKKQFTILFAMGMAILMLGCEAEEGSPDPEELSAQQIENRLYEMENCEFPNQLLSTKCCSLKGTYGGTCAVNREWISNGECSMVEIDGEESEYCCGGKLLVEVGARGYQCVHEL